MKTYIALLRGINVAGQKKMKMADLKTMFLKLGFAEVFTYIQSGNVVFTSDENNTRVLEEQIKKGVAETFGFDVPIVVKTKTQIAKILQESPYTNAEDLEAKRIYYVLLKNEPTAEAIASLVQQDYPNELFSIRKHCVYLNCINGAGKAKLTNNIIERKLKVSATTRNHNTMLKLLALGN